MNTNQLKKFAQDARRKLLEQVGAKLNFVLTTDSAELREKTEQLKQLRLELGRTTKEQLIEKVAYTWFNRLMALRFMDVNDYQPLGIRIITPKDGYTTPELLDEAKRGNIPDELKANRQKIYDILDNKIPSKNPQNEAYKELLIAACNHLNTTFPFLFEKINDYTELLLPDDLTSEFSIVKDVRDGMVVEDCQNVEIIGWLYQFYISEKKDEVFASKSKVKKEDIPAATQLFTPRWIVEYMVQNTLGKLWIQNRPNSRLREHMPYFIESASLEAKDYLKINSPEEIKFLDPASGSGHILVYAFDLLTKIYEEEGYNITEIPQFIIEKNLYGFEIDERAAQLSALVLMMKAREYHHRVFRKKLNPNILHFQDLYATKDEIKEINQSLEVQISNELMHDLLLMQQATNFGSLIIPHTYINETERVFNKLNQFLPNADVFHRNSMEFLIGSIEQLQMLSQKFHCVVANPPYMGGGNMNPALTEFVKINYPDSKADLMACFMEIGLTLIEEKGFLGMINQHSWMFLSSYEALREKLIKNTFIDTLLHLGARTFPEISGEVVQNAAFTIWNHSYNYDGIYIRLVDLGNAELKRNKTIEAIHDKGCEWLYKTNQRNFQKMPSSPIGYWIDKKVISKFSSGTLKDIGVGRNGITTGNNERFLREWYEISVFGLEFHSLGKPQKKWIPYRKGGSFQKWYGNNNLFIDWTNNGYLLKDNPNTIIRNPDYYFQEGLTWSLTGSSGFGARYCDIGGAFDVNGMTYFPNDKIQMRSILSFLNSVIAEKLLELINPTLAFQSGNIESLPILLGDINKIEPIVNACLKLTMEYHSSLEINWTYKNSRILEEIINDSFEDTCEMTSDKWMHKFNSLRSLEEENNKILIETHGLEGCFNAHVSENQITILRELFDGECTTIDFSLLSREFMSHSVGCMFGRYSLDNEGLILANQGQTFQDYLNEIGKSITECNFLPDKDNIIPILDDEWFEDDIVGKFHQFLMVTFGEKNFNKNLAFVEEQIGKDIRKYFIKDFYPDHIKRYKKRPIYWMFSSPKGSFNVLIYMHRYTPDTVSNILNKYLKEFIGKLKTRKEHLEHVQVSGSVSEKNKAIKEIDNIEKMLVELHEYERDILYPLATERIEIDLDDGVLVNYNKFGKAVKEVNGLNDPATKKKVRQFDWIDASQIR